MPEPRTCRRCGAAIPALAPRGACPACLLRDAVESGEPGSAPGSFGRSAPVSVGWGSTSLERADGVSSLPGGPDALSLLSRAYGEMPRVLLRDPADGPEAPVHAPSSDGAGAPGTPPARYQFFGEIARGGMGAILKGYDVELNRDLAVKVLLDRHRHDPELVRRFVEEAQIGGQLQHPGIVPIYELGTLSDCRPFFAMKLIKGRTLAELLADRPDPAADRPRLLGVFEAVAQTVAYAHSRGVIHRDLKPPNVMVGSFGEVQVMDWGLAKVLPLGGVADDRRAVGADDRETVIVTARSGDDSDLGRSRAGSVMGTPSYMAPEQARGENSRLDERTDVFGLGAILCEILTGEPPFAGRDLTELRALAVGGDLAGAWARLEGSGAEPELVALARRCLAPLPDDRPRDAGAVAAAITGHLRGVQERLRHAELARVEAQATAAEEKKRRRMAVGLAGAVVVLVLTVVVGWAWLERQSRRRAARVDLAAHDLEALKLQAEAAGDDPARWAAALEAAHRAESQLDDARDDATRARVAAMVAAIREEVKEVAADARLLGRLAEIRDAAEEAPFAETEADYATAFRSGGFDLHRRRPEETGRSIARRPPRVALFLAAALDHWAAQRRNRGGQEPADWLTAVAQAADPDPWRGRRRSALGEPAGSRRAALVGLARSAPTVDLPPATLALLGQALIDAGDLDTAESVLRPGHRRHPGDFGLTILMAKILQRRSRSQEAIRYFMMATVLRPEAAHLLAHALVDLGEADEAILAFRELARQRPSSARYLGCLDRSFRSAHSSRRADAFSEAVLAEFREAVRLRPDEPESHLSLGDALADLRRHVEAVAEYRKAIQLNPAAATAHLRLADSLKQRGLVDEAIAEFREAIRLQPDSVPAYCALGALLCDVKHDADAAADAFREAIRLDPDHAHAHYNLGNVLTSKGRIDDAIAAYREAIRLEPAFARAHTDLGIALGGKGQVDRALAEFREAVRLAPELAEAHANMGITLAHLGRRDEAIAEIRRAIRLQPDRGLIHFTLASLLFEAGEPEPAIAAFREAIRLEPGLAMIRTNLAVVLGHQGKTDEAIAELREAIRLDPGEAEAYCNLGRFLQRRGEYDEALAALRRGHEIGSRRPGWRYPSADWIRDCERMVALAARLRAVPERESPHAPR